jgi:hypothetical protein
MKFYPCILIPKEELRQAGLNPPTFENGYIADRTMIPILEDYCGKPIVSIRQSDRNDDELIVLIADGYIQYNRITNKRTTVLMGNYDSLRVVLSDIFHERPDEDPYNIFCSYSYQTDITIQLDLQKWVRDQYKK